MNNEKAKVKENKDRPKNVSSCFEGQACAEMMQKIMGGERIGSLCEKMMKSLLKGRSESDKERPEAENKDQNPGGVR
jgi:hypothetical protein